MRGILKKAAQNVIDNRRRGHHLMRPLNSVYLFVISSLQLAAMLF